MKAKRDAYTAGYLDGQKGQWDIEGKYPFPKQTVFRTATMSNGQVVTASTADNWKPPFGKADTIEDIQKLVDLWQFPTAIQSVEDDE